MSGYPKFYKMNHKKRGVAVIFNHEHFENHSKREATYKDSNGIKKVLETFGFSVLEYNDLPYSELLTRLNEVANMDHSECDCLVMVILTHGGPDWFAARDIDYKSSRIFTTFSSKSCPSLIGKPKIFLIQACRGDKVDDGIILRMQFDGSDCHNNLITTEPDFLVAHSTIPEHYAWRNRVKGSVFMQTLIKQLEECGRETDMLTLLTVVNRKMAIDFASNSGNLNTHDKKVVPSIYFTLTRLLSFGEIPKDEFTNCSRDKVCSLC